jgi:hypothetical protein
VTPAKHFVYDTATVNGVAMSNAKGRVAEAYTGSSKTTDLGFSYSARGEAIGAWESTSHSGGYYHVSQGYWANGLVNTLNLNLAGYPSWTLQMSIQLEFRIGLPQARQLLGRDTAPTLIRRRHSDRGTGWRDRSGSSKTPLRIRERSLARAIYGQ